MERGLVRVIDLFCFFPSGYHELTNLKKISTARTGEKVSLLVTIRSRSHRISYGKRIPVTEAVASDDTGSIRLTWFNQPYVSNLLKTGAEVLVFGEIKPGKHGTGMVNPILKVMNPNEYAAMKLEIEPVYPPMGRVSNRLLAGLVRRLLQDTHPLHFDFPDEIRVKRGFPEKRDCLRRIHFPSSREEMEEVKSRSSMAQKALIYEEFFLFFLGVHAARDSLCAIRKKPMKIDDPMVAFLDSIIPLH
ncbi:MAG: hypothetical protein MZV49_09250 [Rhodopseudomonas palustris]|nr:hypothetical protein [Rhodopseudomonas palustris]